MLIKEKPIFHNDVCNFNIVLQLYSFLFQMTRYTNADFADDDSVNSVQLNEGETL